MTATSSPSPSRWNTRGLPCSDPSHPLTAPDLDYGWIKIFEDVTPSPNIDAVLSASERIRLADGEMLIEADQENHHFYILISGEMGVRLTREDTQPGMPIMPGEPIGEMSIIDGRKTSAYVYSVGKSEVLAIREQDFWRHLATHPRVMRNLTRLITHRLRLTGQRIIRGIEQQLQYEHLKKELAAARDIQMGLLPQRVPLFPHHGQVDVQAYLLPAKEVGGDLYDAFPISDGHILVAVGDVSGKGMAAALFMMRTLTLLRAQGCTTTPWAELMPALNRLLCEGNASDMFVTLAIAILSVHDGRLTLFNAGHPPPLLSRQGGAFEVITGTKGALLGISPTLLYQGIEINISRGDRLVMYSDGVTEAENADRAMFDLERTRAALDQHPADGAMDGLVAALARAVTEFSDGVEQSDDITILALRYLGQGTHASSS